VHHVTARPAYRSATEHAAPAVPREALPAKCGQSLALEPDAASFPYDP